jgi:hypothetical protein
MSEERCAPSHFLTAWLNNGERRKTGGRRLEREEKRACLAVSQPAQNLFMPEVASLFVGFLSPAQLFSLSVPSVRRLRASTTVVQPYTRSSSLQSQTADSRQQTPCQPDHKNQFT